MIIDEADMTLEYGFLEDIDIILSNMDKKIQKLVGFVSHYKLQHIYTNCYPQNYNRFYKTHQLCKS